MGAPVLLKNAVDSFVSEKYPAKNFSNLRRLVLADGSSANTRFAYMYFGVPSGMYGTTIISAKLRLYSGDGWGGDVTLRVRRLSERYAARRVNWNNKPGIHGTVAALTKTSAPKYTMWEFDVTAEMQAVANGSPFYGFRLDATNSSTKWLFSAQAHDNYRPQLEITWSDAPDVPEDLKPDDDIVSVAKPTLQWDFTDPSGDQTMQAFDLKLFSTEALADANGAGDLLNEVGVLSDIPQRDLDDTAYAGIADGATVWWRVRVQDGAGLWSGWSDVASFTRIDKGVLTITNPAADPNDFVTESTPPFSWTFTGQTQRAYQIILTTPETPASYIWNSGVITSDDTAVTPPPRKLTETGKTYRLIIRIFDTQSRVALPDDPRYVEAIRDFTFDLSTSVAPVTNFIGVPDLYRPHAILSWERATAPDYFVIMRNGRVIEEVEPSELLVSGTSYTYTDKSAEPRKNHTWRVAAKVNGVTSGNNPPATMLLKAVAPILSEIDGDNELFLFNPNIGADKAESSDVHYIIGDAPPILITQSRRGYEGKVSGVLANDVIPGLTAEDQLDSLEYFRSRQGMELRLTWINKVMTVVIRNISDNPIPMQDGRVEYLASFEFYEVDF